MGLLLKQIFAFLKLLNSETGNNQIAAGVAAGFILGMTPALSLQSLLVFILLFFFRIQIGAALISGFFFAFPAYLLDGVCHQVGTLVLEMPSLKVLFTVLYNMPLVPMTRFNNSIVMGSGVFAIILTPVVFFASKAIIRQYRAQIVARFQQTKFWKLVKATSLYQWYVKYDEYFG